MSIHGMSANRETFLLLGWATRTNMRERLVKAHRERPEDSAAPERILRDELKFSQPPVFEEDSTYGPAYEALFNYRLDQVEYTLAGWALRGYNAVYLKSAEMEVESGQGPTPETDLLWQAIAVNNRLLFQVQRLGREWGGKPHQLANALKLHFTFRIPLLMRSQECCFLFQEFITMSLERVNWLDVACRVLEIPYQPGETVPEEMDKGDYEAMQLALLKETIWRTYVDVGAFSHHLIFSRKVRELCLNLADAGFHTHEAIGKLEEAHSVYDREAARPSGQ